MDKIPNNSNACSLQLVDAETLRGRFCVVRRGSCTFIDKARVCEKAGATGVIVLGEFGASGCDAMVTTYICVIACIVKLTID